MAPAEDDARMTDTPRPALDEQTALDLLLHGEFDVEGRLVDASNVTLYCQVELDGVRANCVYKPVAGERPLWDFPDGTLAGREVAAYEVSRAAGWDVVPPTVYREGPFGPGMAQLWVDADPDVDLMELARGRRNPGLRRMAVFDAVINNADRKIGHLLPLPGGHLYGCDHGVCFSTEYKLRTVLWQWRGEPIPDDSMEALRRLSRGLDGGKLTRTLRPRISKEEIRATAARVAMLLEHRIHPFPPEDWPAVPWPPY